MPDCLKLTTGNSQILRFTGSAAGAAGAAAAAVFFDTSDEIISFVQARPHCAAIRQDFEAMVTGGIDRLMKAIRNESFGETITYTPVETIR